MNIEDVITMTGGGSLSSMQTSDRERPNSLAGGGEMTSPLDLRNRLTSGDFERRCSPELKIVPINLQNNENLKGSEENENNR